MLFLLLFQLPCLHNYPLLVLQCPFTEANMRVKYRFEPKQLEPKRLRRVGLSGEVGPASSHGLDRTAANFTGADQWSSLPCCPERPRAAKSAHMVRSVGSSGIAEMAFCDVLCICARWCNLLLTAWTVQHYCKQCWDKETLTALNSYAWPQVRNRVIFEGATLQVLC